MWELARDIGQQCKTMVKQRQHFVFSEAKIKFETGADTRGLAESTALECVGDVLVSLTLALIPGEHRQTNVSSSEFGNLSFILWRIIVSSLAFSLS